MKLFTISIDSYFANRFLGIFNYVTGNNVTIECLGGQDNGLHTEFSVEPDTKDIAEFLVVVEENKDHIKTAVSSIITAFGAIKSVFKAMKATGRRLEKERRENEYIEPYGSFTEPSPYEKEVA